MAGITNHSQDINIYRMVLDRLPFVVDDCNYKFTQTITDFDAPSNTIKVAGDFTPYMWPNQKQTINKTGGGTTELTVFSFSYNQTDDKTEIVYYQLESGDGAVNDTLEICGNFNDQLISRYIYQMMWQLQACYQIVDSGGNPAVGDESLYSLLQKMVIADLVSWYILFRQTLINSQGNANDDDPAPDAPPQRYVQTAKTGEVSTTWSYVKLNDTAYASIDAEKMMAAFKDSAVCLAQQLGCVIEVCADGSVSCSCVVSENRSPIIENPFIVAGKLPSCRPPYFGGSFFINTNNKKRP